MSMWFSKFAAMGGSGLRWPHSWEVLFAREDALEAQIEDPQSCKEPLRALLRAIPSKQDLGGDDVRNARMI